MTFTLRTIAGGCAICCLFFIAAHAGAQESGPYFRRKIVSVFGEYSNTSSHIVEGVSRRRRFVNVGATYDIGGFTRHGVSLYYEASISPLIFIQDPVTTRTITSSDGNVYRSTDEEFGMCIPGTAFQAAGFPPVKTTCGTRWTYSGSVSPAGFRLNLRRGHRVQPVINGGGSLVFSVNQTPVTYSKQLNYMGDLGVGFEVFTSASRSWAVQYRVYHLSNGYTADANPGIDGQLVRVSYSFGR